MRQLARGSNGIIHLLVLGLVIAVELVWQSEAKASQNDDFGLIRSRLEVEALKLGYAKANANLAAMSQDGHWDDINYADRSRASWAPVKHIDRLATMAVAYADPSSPDYHSSVMLAGIIKGLGYWFQRKPESDNWWYNTIGLQLSLGHVVDVVYDELPSDQQRECIALFNDPAHVDLKLATGENLVWYASEQLVRGVLTKSNEDVLAATQAIQNEIRITTEEGIQPDFSYHQHGPQLYNGGYGLGFITDSIDRAELVQGTKFAFAPDRIALLTDYLLDGTRYMIRNQWLDYDADGRNVTRRIVGKEALSLVPVCDSLLKLNPYRTGELIALKQHIQGDGLPYSFLGNKYFWCSDFMTHQRDGFYLSVKMVSSRTKGTETINGENLKGCWIPYGLTWIVRNGQEYKDIFPVLDWGRLPGVTCPHLAQADSGKEETESFVGGASDGLYGAAAMDLNVMSTQGHKSWFFFDNGMVCLGSGITSTQNEPINTSINQTLLNGPAIVDGKQFQEGQFDLPSETSWILSGGIGYVMLSPATVKLKIGAQSGDWRSINSQYPSTTISKSVFSLWIDHGIQPKDASYAYAVLPGADENSLGEFCLSPFKVLNTIPIQAVIDEANRVAEMVFYKPGSMNLPDGLSLEVDHSCIVILRKKGEKLSISSANPEAQALVLNVKVKTAAEVQDVTFALPGGSTGGMSKATEISLAW